jgi:hypothetical protein
VAWLGKKIDSPSGKLTLKKNSKKSLEERYKESQQLDGPKK